MKRFSLSVATKRRVGLVVAAVTVIAITAVGPTWNAHAVPVEESPPAAEANAAPTDSVHLAKNPEEARIRAQLLHEMIHGALQVMHRDFFDEEESHTLPSRSLEDVFAAMADQWQVEIRWFAVNAQPMDVDHKPQDDFEKAAAKALAAGDEEYKAIEGDKFRYAGTIRLGSQCLKCHVPKRTSLEDRAAGLAITMPFKNK